MKAKKTNEYLSPSTWVLPFKMEQVICWSAQSSTDDFTIETDETDDLFDDLF